jgi:hypothetical protein
MRNRNRKTRQLRVESLESRQLMAADVQYWVRSGTLGIEGTSGRDIVEVNFAQGSPILKVAGRPTIQIQGSFTSIVANMGAGTDSFTIQGQNRALNNVTINMGSGSSEAIFLNQLRLSNLSIDANLAVGTGVKLASVTVVGKASVNFGDGAGNDDLNLISGSDINNLWARFGDGADQFGLARSVVKKSDVNMGKGNDSFTSDDQSNIFAGIVDGGEGDRDLKRVGKAGVKASLKSFEK